MIYNKNDKDYQKYKELLNSVAPKHLGMVFPIGESPVPLTGDSINRHLSGCGLILISCATLGGEFDRTLRQLQLTDMAGAVMLDTMSGSYINSFINKKDKEFIGKRQKQSRFSPGYGDFPLSANRDILDALNAQKTIGLCTTDEFILTPQKSITGITGIK